MPELYPFAVKLDICLGSCNTLTDLSNKVCALKKNRIFKYTCSWYDYRNRLIKNFNKTCIMQI